MCYITTSQKNGEAAGRQLLRDLGKEKLKEVGFGGFHQSKDCLTYMRNGIRIHKPPFEGHWAEKGKGYLKFAEFVSPDGIVTDQFFGTCNDFDFWMKAKACKGERFFVIFYPNDPKEDKVQLVVEVDVWLGSYYEWHPWSSATLEQGEDLRWRLADNEVDGQ